MEPFFFGPRDRQLFGSYHAPVGGPGHVLTVICPPLLNEVMRTHLALRDLAICLAERGHHVLRFDYLGTGDSFGDLDVIDLSQWLDDIALAVREGCDLSGSSVVRVVAVRAAALLACKSLGALRDVSRLVLWDPVPDGADYLCKMRRIQETVLERGAPQCSDPREGCREFAGMRLSERMVKELSSLDDSVYLGTPKDKLHVVVTSTKDEFPVSGVRLDVVPFDCKWETELEDLLIAKPVLQQLASCLTLS